MGPIYLVLPIPASGPTSPIHKLSDSCAHRPADRIIFSAAMKFGPNIRSAIVCPPGIYGRGLGPVEDQSYLVPSFVKDVLTKFQGKGFYVKEGRNNSSHTYIGDLLVVYKKLVEAAAKVGDGGDWGEDGLYFVPTHEEISFREFAETTQMLLKKHGATNEDIIVPRGLEDYANFVDGSDVGLMIYGSAGRTKTDRVKQRFGLVAEGPTILQALEQDVVAALNDKQRDENLFKKLLGSGQHRTSTAVEC